MEIPPISTGTIGRLAAAGMSIFTFKLASGSSIEVAAMEGLAAAATGYLTNRANAVETEHQQAYLADRNHHLQLEIGRAHV